MFMYSRQSPGVSANAAVYACTHSTQHSTARQHSKTANLLMFNNSQQSQRGSQQHRHVRLHTQHTDQ